MGRRKRKPPVQPADTPASPRPSIRSRRRFTPRGIATLVVLLTLFSFGGIVFADWWSCMPQNVTATYIGSQSCVECHQPEYDKWRGSHHDLAMDRATPETVLGDFDNAEFTNFGITSRLFQRDGGYFINTEGPDGEMADFEVKYVFGVNPLQQYMVEFDRPADMPEDEIARLQVLRISWDTKRKRWFYLPPPDVAEKLSPDDELHWTGVASCWNNMCADCHSTNLRKRFNHETGIYHTTYSEIDVSCEACHGPGSLHVELSKQRGLFWDRRHGYGLPKLKGENPEPQIQMCAPCHSRRRMICPDFRPGDNYYDFFDCELLEDRTYYPDGQILDEDYVYGSFIQSKMYHKGIRCSDCHDPHTVDTTEMRERGNNVCTSCHAHPAGKYDSPSHHHHQPGSTGALCAECHMPETTYMEVDPRRDHSIRVPRPDLSVSLHTPNACTRCHIDREIVPEKLLPADKEIRDRGDLPVEYQDWLLAAREGDEEVAAELKRLDAWCVEYMDEWYNETWRRGEHFSHAMAQGREREPEAELKLIELSRNKRLPDMVRATALSNLGPFVTPTRPSMEESLLRLQDRDPKVRAAALRNLESLPEDALVEAAAPLLRDPIRLVRTEAARVLARTAGSVMSGAERRDFEAGLEELKRSLMVSNDRAAAHMSLGVVYETLGEVGAARQAYETAIRVEPRVTGPRSNLALLLERSAEAAAASAERAIGRRDQEAYIEAATQADALAERSKKLRAEELDNLARDARLVPNSGALQYRYGLSLYLHGRMEDAEVALEKACELEPNTADFRLGLALFYQKLERFDEALEQALALHSLRNDEETRQLVESIRQQAGQR